MTTRQIERVRTAAIKIGGSSVQAEHGPLDIKVLRSHFEDIGTLWKGGRRFVVVLSGAVPLGFDELGMNGAKESEKREMVTLAASVGQRRLMEACGELFREEELHVGQLLPSSEQLEGRDVAEVSPEVIRRLKRDVEQAFANNVVQVINENDPFAPASLTRMDNDGLAAKVTIYLDLDALVILSTKNGPPGRGGANTKGAAIEEVERAGRMALVVDGKERHVISKLFESSEGEVFKAAVRDSHIIKSSRE